MSEADPKTTSLDDHRAKKNGLNSEVIDRIAINEADRDILKAVAEIDRKIRKLEESGASATETAQLDLDAAGLLSLLSPSARQEVVETFITIAEVDESGGEDPHRFGEVHQLRQRESETFSRPTYPEGDSVS